MSHSDKNDISPLCRNTRRRYCILFDSCYRNSRNHRRVYRKDPTLSGNNGCTVNEQIIGKTSKRVRNIENVVRYKRGCQVSGKNVEEFTVNKSKSFQKENIERM